MTDRLHRTPSITSARRHGARTARPVAIETAAGRTAPRAARGASRSQRLRGPATRRIGGAEASWARWACAPGLVLLLLGTAILSTDAAAQGCAMCGTAVSSAKDPLARGLFWSILLMLAVPNLLVASFGGWLFYVYRRASRDRSACENAGLHTDHSDPGEKRT